MFSRAMTAYRRVVVAFRVLSGQEPLQQPQFNPALFSDLLTRRAAGEVGGDEKELKRLRVRVGYLEGRNKLGLERYREVKAHVEEFQKQFIEIAEVLGLKDDEALTSDQVVEAVRALRIRLGDNEPGGRP